MRILMAAALAASAWSAPAYADVKAGVDAWSRGDYKAAIAEWRGPAVAGDPDAQFNLGQAYKLGRGVPVDLKLAESWYRKAALSGHYQAEDMLGLTLFQNGSRVESMPWLEKSAARGEPRAQYLYGTALFNGEFVAKDWTRAYALMTRASAAGLPEASRSLAQMDRYVPLAQRQRGLAMARDLEVAAARPVPPMDTPGASPPVKVRPTEIPPSTTPPERASGGTAPAPRPAPPVTGKGWRVQLGAFGNADNARALWSSTQPRVAALASMQPFLVKSGAITKLQAGPFATRAEAARACTGIKATGGACLLIAP